MTQTGAQFNLSREFKKWRGGWGVAAAPPMMLEEVMIQLGMQANLCRESKRGANQSLL